MAQDHSDEHSPVLSDATNVEVVIGRFEDAWQCDESPTLDQFLAETVTGRNELLRELVAIDLEYRLKRGEPIRVENYFQRFPDLTEDESYCRQLVADEFHVRQQMDSAVSFAEYDQRFPKLAGELRSLVATNGQTQQGRRLPGSSRLNCPYCHSSIEVVSEARFDTVVCPSCGSTVHLDAGQSVTCHQQRVPQIAEFELLEVVGRGAFGTVYKARDQQLQRVVAIKVPRSGVLETEEDENRFVREARHAAQLHHPGIVAIHSVGRTETFPYLISEFVEGVTLAQSLTTKRFVGREAAKLVRDIALALQHAHAQGVVHRDLKPSNIMLTPEGTPRLMDFGLAKRDAGEITMTLDGQILGTPAYMSPEQARGDAHRADARSDIYSLGVILFQLLTGELPFRGDVRMMLQQVVNDEPPHPRQLSRNVPRDLDTVCMKCLAKEPPRRYATANDLADDLRRFLDGRPILARPVDTVERAWRWIKRNRGTAALSAAILFLIVGIAIGSTIGMFVIGEQKRQAETARDQEKRARDAERIQRDDAIAAKQKAVEERDRADASDRMSKHYLYDAHMNLAQAAWEESHVGRVLQLLDKYSSSSPTESLRGFEWFYWNRLCRRERKTLQCHQELVWSVAFAPDGERLATASADRTVKIWEWATGREIMTLGGHNERVRHVAYSPDGSLLASCDKNTIRLWDPATGMQISVLDGHSDYVESVAFSPDGKRLASASYDQTVKMWDLASGLATMTLKGHTAHVTPVVFSPDGTRLASGSSDGVIKLWDATAGVETMTLKGHATWVISLAFSPDGTKLVSASADNSVKLWQVASGRNIQTLKGHTDWVMGVAFNGAGQLASGSQDQTVRLWDVDSGQETDVFKGHTSVVSSVAFHPNGTLLASASWDGTVKLWDFRDAKVPRTLRGHSKILTSAAFSPYGEQIASASTDQTIRLWNVATGEESRRIEGHSDWVECVAFSPDGNRIASASEDKSIKLWDVESGNEIKVFIGHMAGVTSVVFSPDGAFIASGSNDQTARMWDVSSGNEIQSFIGHTGAINTVAINSDGARLASASQDRTVKVWNTKTGECVLTLNGHNERVWCVAFSPNDTYVASAGYDRTVKLWNLSTGKELLACNGHTEAIYDVTFSPDGQRIASASDDRTTRLWDVATGQEILTLKGHTSWVRSVAFSPNGNRLVTASADATLKLWDATPLDSADATRPE